MKLATTQTVNTAILVIGGGGAGLRAAIEAKKSGLDVLLVSESPVGLKNNTAISGGGFAAPGIWGNPEDSPEVHFRDTIVAGRFINDQKMLETMTRRSTQQFYDLKKFGVNKYEEKYERIDLPGHTYPRTTCVEKEMGVNLTRPMRQYAISTGIQFMEGILVTKLLRADGAVVGALGIDAKGQIFIINAKSTIIATGGTGHLFLRTDNAKGMTGDGYTLAYEVGAILRDMEFIQFYPTGWGKNGSKLFFYEEFIAKGATFRNSLGEDIIERYGEKLPTRDVLTRIVMNEIVTGRGIEDNIVCDLTHVPEEERIGYPGNTHYPEKLRVAPTQHFFMGGIKICDDVEVGIDGLYAAGEVCGGAQGANRLASNAIGEILVFGTIAGHRAASRASKVSHVPAPQSEITSEIERLNELASGNNKDNLKKLELSLKQIMWDKVGVIRNKQGIEDAQREIPALREQLGTASLADYRQLLQAIKLANMLTVSEMICGAALTRTESRGAHYRSDYPEEDNEQWLKTIEICCQNRKMATRTVPVDINKEYYEPD